MTAGIQWQFPLVLPAVSGGLFPPGTQAGFTFRTDPAAMEFAAAYIAAGYPGAVPLGGVLDLATAGAAVDTDAANANLNPYFSGTGSVKGTAITMNGSARHYFEVKLELLAPGAIASFGVYEDAAAYNGNAFFGGGDSTTGRFLQTDGYFSTGDGFVNNINDPYWGGYPLPVVGDVIGFCVNYDALAVFINGTQVITEMFNPYASKVILSVQAP